MGANGVCVRHQIFIVRDELRKSPHFIGLEVRNNDAAYRTDIYPRRKQVRLQQGEIAPHAGLYTKSFARWSSDKKLREAKIQFFDKNIMSVDLVREDINFRRLHLCVSIAVSNWRRAILPRLPNFSRY